jgi:hypothetical protein
MNNTAKGADRFLAAKWFQEEHEKHDSHVSVAYSGIGTPWPLLAERVSLWLLQDVKVLMNELRMSAKELRDQAKHSRLDIRHPTWFSVSTEAELLDRCERESQLLIALEQQGMVRRTHSLAQPLSVCFSSGLTVAARLTVRCTCFWTPRSKAKCR